ncbi:hypothetical protein P691DRAFT_790034 [Macrolepiota fuliginosa MF-IS2]|uniref:Uncharacterized protein n=1 Tax=Macrolepiota fuliginosa MF-IS2 TaxID=1400762 RepID=A0A9P5XFE2_9AGAR|nr:hypothetical protein P691DRAFT_790034 [Macrolepiota fuliginosa MF-IS2]
MTKHNERENLRLNPVYEQANAWTTHCPQIVNSRSRPRHVLVIQQVLVASMVNLGYCMIGVFINKQEKGRAEEEKGKEKEKGSWSNGMSPIVGAFRLDGPFPDLVKAPASRNSASATAPSLVPSMSGSLSLIQKNGSRGFQSVPPDHHLMPRNRSNKHPQAHCHGF